jgi:hypothetical protein
MSELQIEYIPLHYTEGLTQEQIKAFRIMDLKYASHIIERWENFTNKKAEKQ